MDLALSVPQTAELWDRLDTDLNGTISQTEFEEYLLDVKAYQTMHTEQKTSKLQSYLIVGELQTKVGEKALERKFTRLFGAALDTRLAMATEASGVVERWVFRAALRKVKMKSLTPFQQSSLRNVFDQLFRRLDHDHSNSVRIDDVQFFVRSAMMKVQEYGKKTGTKMNKLMLARMSKRRVFGALIARAREPPTPEARRRLMLKLGKTLWDRAEATVSGKACKLDKETRESNIMDHFSVMLRELDTEGRGHVTVPSFIKLFKLLGLNMTTSQETAIFDAIDTDESGTIEHKEFLSFLKSTRVLLDKKAAEDAEANDPRNFNPLVEHLLRNVSNKPQIMEPVLRSVKATLMGHGVGIGGGAALGYDDMPSLNAPK